jgi:hypothetical protein
MSESQASEAVQPAYEPPQLTRHGKLAEVTQHTPAVPDALDSTMWPGERSSEPDEAEPR